VSKRTLGAALVAGCAVVLLAAPAGAHALLRSSSPSAGERLADAPRVVSLTFTEPPEVDLSSVQVLDASGQTFQEGDPRVASGDEFTLEVEVGDLSEGVYTVTWRTVSKADGHATAGTFAFGVGVEPSAGAGSGTGSVENPPISPLEIIGRFLFLAGIVFSVGAGTIGAVVARSRSGALFVQVALALGAALVGLVVLLVAQLRAADSSFSVFLGTPVGAAILWRGGGLVLAAVFALAARRNKGSRVNPLFAGVAIGAAIAAFAHVEAGHAAAQTTLRWPNVVGQWVHVVAAGVWIGGLAALLMATRGEPDVDKAHVVRRFSTLAAFTLVVVAVTGVLRALNEIDGWDELFSSGYGRTVIAKVVGIVVLAGLGALNRYRSVPAASRNLSLLRRVGRVEVFGGIVVIALAGLLASISPPAPSDVAAAQAPTIVVTGSDFATSVRTRLRIEPGTAGLNSFRAEISDYDSGDPISARRVTIRFSFADGSVAPSELELERREPGVYAAEGANLSLDGRWEATVVIEQEQGSLEVPLEIETACRAERIVDPGKVPISIMQLGDGRNLQGYVDRGPGGGQLVHLTFFDANGGELRVTDAPLLTAAKEDDETAVDVRRLGPGHFAGSGSFEPGEWRFRIAATVGGEEVSACFQEPIE
jgi:copper transport protein